MKQLKWVARFLVLLLVAVLGIALSGGCGKNPLRDTRNPYYRRGYKLLQERKYSEAAAAFERSLRLDPASAMSHLQLGILCEDTFKDPARAIYHYDTFLRQRPESSRAEAVERWKVRAEKQFFEQLKGVFSGTDTLEQGADVPATGREAEAVDPSSDEKLTEREALLLRRVRELTMSLQEARQQTALMRESRPLAELSVKEPASTPSPAPTERISLLPSVGNDTAESAQGPVTGAATGRSRGTGPAGSVSSGRVHIIARGDTLSSISRTYYGSLKYWPLLGAENKDTLGKNDTLVVGRSLRIPPLGSLTKEKPEPANE